MHNKLNTFNFSSALYTWIYKITATRSLNVLKKQKIKKDNYILVQMKMLKTKVMKILLKEWKQEKEFKKMEKLHDKVTC